MESHATHASHMQIAINTLKDVYPYIADDKIRALAGDIIVRLEALYSTNEKSDV